MGRQQTIYQAASLLLDYPGEELLGQLDLIETAVAGAGAADAFAPVIRHLRGRGLTSAQEFHVAEFDLSRRHSLHLTYWTAGDTRRRGMALLDVKQSYAASEAELTVAELPDYLPALLEFAAIVDPPAGFALLKSLRPAVELVRIALAEDDLPHAGVLAAVCSTFPGRSPATRADVQALMAATAVPESVGIDLIPLEPLRS